MKNIAIALLFVFAGSLSARADSQPIGIGFVQAEEGTWWCRAASAAKAFDCARDKCKASAGDQDCHEARWCGLAAWSGLMVIWLPEFHATTILCGAPSEAAVTAALKALCDNDEVVTRCELTALIDPDGKEKTGNVIWPGPTATAPGEEPAPE